MKGTQHRMVCPSCGKVFFAWRPDTLPGAPVKCYFCGHTFQDEAARRSPVPAPAAAAAPAAPAERAGASPAATAASPAAPAVPVPAAAADPKEKAS